MGYHVYLRFDYWMCWYMKENLASVRTSYLSYKLLINDVKPVHSLTQKIKMIDLNLIVFFFTTLSVSP